MFVFFLQMTALPVTVRPKAGSCTTERDCSMNGDCVHHVCVCDPAWRGSPQCDVFEFVPASRSRTGYHNTSASSWGGNVAGPDANGTYHLFAAQVLNECGLDAYGTNSAIVRATSREATGPFTFAEVILLPFAHNPQISKLPANGGYVLFFIGDGTENTSLVQNCTNTSAVSVTSKLVGGEIHAMWSPTLLGPWNSPVKIEFNDTGVTNSSGSPLWLGGGYNPSVWVSQSGVAHLAVHRTFSASPGKELLGVAVATSWKGPYRMVTRKPIRPETGVDILCIAGTGEDPFIYRGQRGNALHVIWHGALFFFSSSLYRLYNM